MRNGLNKTLRSEEGSMMVIALLVLVILTLIGTTIATTTKVEIQIAGNERYHKIAFHLADSGTMVAPKVISTCLESAAEENISGVTYLGTSGT
ncbi:MAG TPA: PilX N-terminal domain-containing pilus assembly protein, partial [Desulfatiglandales bacterium]|nr:PilX N-terminal domain-containing pilus assembly protein [Desulfatiglandales bacterium]